MLEVKSKQIGDWAVKVQQFAGRKNLDILVDLSALIGPAIAAAVPKGGSVLDSELDVAAIADALMKNMNSAKVGSLVMRMLGSTVINDRVVDETQFDMLFAGPQLWELPKVLAFVVEVNFGNFSALVGSVSVALGNQQAQAQAN